jgi:acyl carrier protein
MTHEQILAALADIIRDVLDEPDLAISERTRADDVEAWDSFSHINIVVATEGRFRVKFNTVEIEGLRDVGDFVALIEKKIG